MFGLEPAKKINYIQCQKGGYHDGQLLNIVCLEPTCLQMPACCCACIEESHKKHETMPLKKIVTDAREKVGSSKVSNFNSDVMLNILETNQKKAYETFTITKNNIKSSIINMETLLQGYFAKMGSQLSTSGQNDVGAALQVLSGGYSVEDLNIWSKKLVQAATKTEGGEITDGDLANRLNENYEWYNEHILKVMEEAHEKFNNIVQHLKTAINELDIWKKSSSYSFSQTYKQKDVSLLSQTIVKSTSSDAYKFSMMDPSIETSTLKEFKFKMKKIVSTWVAVGMCHRDIVVAKDYRFNFSNTGHGAYMVSSNGGVWSNTRSQHNNKVSTYHFQTGDIIHVKVDLGSKKVKFIKNNNSGSWETTFTQIAGDKLYPCVLFYFKDDEVEYLPAN